MCCSAVRLDADFSDFLYKVTEIMNSTSPQTNSTPLCSDEKEVGKKFVWEEGGLLYGRHNCKSPARQKGETSIVPFVLWFLVDSSHGRIGLKPPACLQSHRAHGIKEGRLLLPYMMEEGFKLYGGNDSAPSFTPWKFFICTVFHISVIYTGSFCPHHV